MCVHACVWGVNSGVYDRGELPGNSSVFSFKTHPETWRVEYFALLEGMGAREAATEFSLLFLDLNFSI